MAKRIVAVALVTEAELAMFGKGFERAFRIDDTPCFGELIAAIDEADREFRCMTAEQPRPKVR